MMNSQQTNHHHSNPDYAPVHHLPPVQVKPPPSPSFSSVSFSTPSSTPTATPTSSATHRRIAIAVDLSDESAFAVKWAVQNYLRPGDGVILLHVRSTSVLYGADWGSTTPNSAHAPPPSPYTATSPSNPSPQDEKLEEDFDNLTNAKATNLAQPLVEAHMPFKIHIVKDHDMKERLCLEVERLGLSAVIMGSRGFGASRRNSKGRLGSVSDYCVHHCVCPVVVVRYPEERNGVKSSGGCEVVKKAVTVHEPELHPVPEEEPEYHDADDHESKVISIESGNSEGKEQKM